MDYDDELVIERHPDGSVKASVITDLEAFKRRMHERVIENEPVSLKWVVEESPPPVLLDSPKSPKPEQIPYIETYETKRQKVISNCPSRSYKKYEMVAGQLKIDHLFRDGSPAEGCGCSSMRCLLGKGNQGLVTIDDCTKCMIEAGKLDSEHPVEFPSLLQMAATYAISTAKHIAAGSPIATEQEQERRLAICRGCVQYDAGRCRVCGCHLENEKVARAGETCPLQHPKWGPVTAASTETDSELVPPALSEPDRPNPL